MSSHFNAAVVAAPTPFPAALDRLTAGAPIDLGDGLVAVPVELLDEANEPPAVMLFAEDNPVDVRIDEVGAGSVSCLRVSNDSESMVLVVAGQLIRGGKQNRGVNADALIPAGASVDIPVSCVERDRWSGGTASRNRFRPAGIEPMALRAAKHRGVSMSTRDAATRGRLDPQMTHAVDQQAVWRMIAELQAMAGVHSPSADLVTSLDSHDRLERGDRPMELPPSDRRVGTLYFLDGGFIGGDVFASAQWAAQFEHDLVRSAAMSRDHVRRVQLIGRTPEYVAPEASPVSEQALGERAAALLDAALYGRWSQRPAVGCERVEALDCPDFLATATIGPAHEPLHILFSSTKPLVSIR